MRHLRLFVLSVTLILATIGEVILSTIDNIADSLNLDTLRLSYHRRHAYDAFGYETERCHYPEENDIMDE